MAVQKGDLNLVKLIVDSGADLNAADCNGHSPVAVAYHKGASMKNTFC
jgi:hypothetical protein